MEAQLELGGEPGVVVWLPGRNPEAGNAAQKGCCPGGGGWLVPEQSLTPSAVKSNGGQGAASLAGEVRLL